MRGFLIGGGSMTLCNLVIVPLTGSLNNPWQTLAVWMMGMCAGMLTAYTSDRRRGQIVARGRQETV